MPRRRDYLPDYAVRDPCNPVSLADRDAGHPHIVKHLVTQLNVELLELRYIAATGEPLHDIHGALILHPRALVVNIQTLIIVFSAVITEEKLFIDH